MKKCIILSALVLVMIAGCIAYIPRGDDQGSYPDDRQSPGYYGDRDVSYFYEYLAPHGTWVQMSAYGYVWVPRNMGYRWRPYMYGRWTWTDYGWTWISDDEWGWIPFHYGRWGWDDDMGWFWVPGTVWGPAWVFWRTSDLYFGWAPLPPGLDFDMRNGFRSRRYDIPDRFWIFVEGRNFFERDLYRRAIPFERNTTIIRNTVMNDRIVLRNSRVINEGIDPGVVRRLTGQTVERFSLRDARQAGPDQVSGGEVRIFRPNVRGGGTSRPTEYLGSTEARTRLGEAKIFEPGRRASDADPLETIQRRHTEEVQILERSQTNEIRRLDQNFAERESRVRATERDKIRREHDAAVTELKTRHVQEKQAVNDRQKKDVEAVRGRAVRRK